MLTLMETNTLLFLVKFSRCLDLAAIIVVFTILADTSSSEVVIGVTWVAFLCVVISLLFSSSTEFGSRGVLHTDRTLRLLHASAVASFVFAIAAVELCLFENYFIVKVKLGKSRFNDLYLHWKIIFCVGCGITELMLILAAIHIYKMYSVIVTKQKVKAELPQHPAEPLHTYQQQVTQILQAQTHAQTQLLDAYQQQVTQILQALTQMTEQLQVLSHHIQDVAQIS